MKRSVGLGHSVQEVEACSLLWLRNKNFDKLIYSNLMYPRFQQLTSPLYVCSDK